MDREKETFEKWIESVIIINFEGRFCSKLVNKYLAVFTAFKVIVMHIINSLSYNYTSHIFSFAIIILYHDTLFTPTESCLLKLSIFSGKPYCFSFISYSFIRSSVSNVKSLVLYGSYLQENLVCKCFQNLRIIGK